MILTGLGIATAAAGLGSMIFGGIKSSKARKREEERLREQERQARRDFDRDYYADMTQRADMRYLLNKQRENLQEAADTAYRRNIVAGGTTESYAKAQQSAVRALADSTARIGALSQQQKQAAQSAYTAARGQNNAAWANINATDAQQGANLAKSGAALIASGMQLAGSAEKPADTQTPKQNPMQSNTEAIEAGEIIGTGVAKPEENPLYKDLYA